MGVLVGVECILFSFMKRFIVECRVKACVVGTIELWRWTDGAKGVARLGFHRFPCRVSGFCACSLIFFVGLPHDAVPAGVLALGRILIDPPPFSQWKF